MITKGLKPPEAELLASAGFAPDAVRVITDEAERLRWLFLKRPGAGALWWGAGIIAAVIIGGLWQATGIWGALAVPVLAAGTQIIAGLADVEINAPKSNDPPRWAARRMAQLSLKAAAMTAPEKSEAFGELQAHAEAGSGLSSPWSVMRIIAGHLAAPKPRAGLAGTARKSAGSGDSLGATLRFGLIILAIVVIIITLALGARPF